MAAIYIEKNRYLDSTTLHSIYYSMFLYILSRSNSFTGGIYPETIMTSHGKHERLLLLHNYVPQILT